MNLSVDHDDLPWQAFLYVAQEMSDEERHAFEERLFESQEAREAVAQAIELSQNAQAAWHAAPARVARADAGWARRAAWMAVGAAACLALVAFASQLRPSPAGRPGQTAERGAPAEAASSSTSRALAMAWSEQLQVGLALASELGVGEFAWQRGDAEAVSSFSREPSLADLDDEPLDSVAAPSWMLAAVCHADLRRQEKGTPASPPEESVP